MPYLTPDTVPTETICYFIRLPNEPLIKAAFMGAVSELFKVWNWELFGEITPQEIADAFLPIYQLMAETPGACMLGSIIPFATTNLPSNVLLCDGTQYARTSYPNLYDVLDSAFIDDGDYFHVPNLQGQFIKGTGTDNTGDTGGNNSYSLSTTHLPSHDHLYNQHTLTPITIGAGAPIIAYTPPDIPTLTSQTGSGNPFDNQPAYTALVYGIVAL